MVSEVVLVSIFEVFWSSSTTTEILDTVLFTHFLKHVKKFNVIGERKSKITSGLEKNVLQKCKDFYLLHPPKEDTVSLLQCRDMLTV